MSSVPPRGPDESEMSTADGTDTDPDSDDTDTGPIRSNAYVHNRNSGWEGQRADSRWVPEPADDRSRGPDAHATWAGRFDGPLTVSPRQRQRNPKALLYTAGAIVTVAVVAAVVFLLSRPSADDHDAATIGRSTTATPQAPPTQNADEERLLRMVPRGYAQDACRTADASNGASAQVNCGRNSDAGGPLSATYTLAAGKAELDAAFNDAMADAERVNCPGNIQSPGPWRRNAAPEKVAGTLFCGLRDGRPTVAWTDDARLVVSVAHAGPSGPAFPELYAWWSSHS